MSRREFSKISPVIWRSKRFLALPTDRARLLLLYLLTSSHQNSSGAYRIPEGYACVDLAGWPIEEYRAALAALQASRLIVYDEQTEEVFIDGWFRVNPPQNPKHAAGIITRISELDSDLVREAAEEEFREVNVAINRVRNGNGATADWRQQPEYRGLRD